MKQIDFTRRAPWLPFYSSRVVMLVTGLLTVVLLRVELYLISIDARSMAWFVMLLAAPLAIFNFCWRKKVALFWGNLHSLSLGRGRKLASQQDRRTWYTNVREWLLRNRLPCTTASSVLWSREDRENLATLWRALTRRLEMKLQEPELDGTAKELLALREEITERLEEIGPFGDLLFYATYSKLHLYLRISWLGLILSFPLVVTDESMLREISPELKDQSSSMIERIAPRKTQSLLIN